MQVIYKEHVIVRLFHIRIRIALLVFLLDQVQVGMVIQSESDPSPTRSKENNLIRVQGKVIRLRLYDPSPS